uniref:Transmembrane protein 135 N-terminal domain-containing protein n=1 Tax=Globodera rostochiensis TaxID=31243 RepID=A0A914HH02_GLORO
MDNCAQFYGWQKALQPGIGRILRHDNATDTRVCAKKIAIVEQLRGEGDEVPDSSTDAVAHRHPQKGLDELVAQLGHYNENICRDAIHGVRLQFKDSSEQLRRHLRKIIPAIGSLINRELKLTATRNQLKRLIEMVCAVPSEVISSHFGLFCGYVLTGISDVRAPIRTLSFDVLTLLLQKYGRLCSQNRELFSAFLQLMGGQRKPENRTKLLDALSQFIVVFGVFNDNKLWPERTLTISFEKGMTETRSSASAVSLLPSAAYFHFPVLCLDSANSVDGTSPLMTRDGLLNCCRIFCPLLEAIIQVEKDADGTKFTSTMSRVHNVVSRLVDVSLHVLNLQFDGAGELRGQIVAIFGQLRRCPLTEFAIFHFYERIHLLFFPLESVVRMLLNKGAVGDGAAARERERRLREQLFRRSVATSRRSAFDRRSDTLRARGERTNEMLSTLVGRMGEQVEHSEQTTAALVHSSSVLRESHSNFTAVGNAIRSGGKLISKYGRRETTDKILIVLWCSTGGIGSDDESVRHGLFYFRRLIPISPGLTKPVAAPRFIAYFPLEQFVHHRFSPFFARYAQCYVPTGGQHFWTATYGSLYALKALVDRRGRVDRVDWVRVLLNTVRSSVFLTATEILFLAWLCVFRRLLGFATWPTVSVLNAFFACLMSIWIESKARRGTLVPYLLNLASEAFFRQAQNRHWIRSDPPPFARAQSLLFGASVAISVAILSRKRPVGQKSARSAEFWRSVLHRAVGFADGEDENGEIVGKRKIHSNDPKRRLPSICGVGGRNCPDSHYNCAMKAFNLSLKNFSLSLAALTLLKLFSALRSVTKGPQKFLRPPFSTFSRSKNAKKLIEHFRVPTFVGVLPLLCQFSQCIFARLFPTKNASIARPIGFGLSAAFAMAFLWPNNNLALYAFWKMAEFAYFRLADAGIVPVYRSADALLFSVLSAYLLSLAVLEPHALRPNYYKFLCSLTGNRLQHFNRPLFDRFFGTSSSTVLHRDYRPEIMPQLRTINPAQYLSPLPINR